MTIRTWIYTPCTYQHLSNVMTPINPCFPHGDLHLSCVMALRKLLTRWQIHLSTQVAGLLLSSAPTHVHYGKQFRIIHVHVLKAGEVNLAFLASHGKFTSFDSDICPGSALPPLTLIHNSRRDPNLSNVMERKHLCYPQRDPHLSGVMALRELFARWQSHPSTGRRLVT